MTRITNEWLRNRIEQEPDNISVEAGDPLPTKKAQLLKLIDEGEVDLVSAADDLRCMGADPDEIRAAVGESNWLWLKAWWKRQGKSLA